MTTTIAEFTPVPPVAISEPSLLSERVRPLVVAIVMIAVWAVWAAVFNTAQFGDNVEQFNWAQSLELGYHKHPPMPSWLLGALVQTLGPSVYWAYLLAAGCLAGTAVFTWLLGRDIFGERVASAGALLWGLNMSVSQRAQLYNHNTVLVLFVAAFAWAAWRASRAERSALAWWALAGALAAGATLAKYQAVVPLAAIVAMLGATGRLAPRRQTVGLLLGVLVFATACTPHVLWVSQHGFTTVRYASEAVADAGPVRRLGFVLSFFANQLRLWLPALLAILVCAAWDRVRPRVAPARSTDVQAGSNDARPWLIGLVGIGVVTLVVLALVFGVSLRNHWGVQALQFFGLALAWQWQRRRTIDLRRLTAVALVVHAASLAGYAVEHHDPAGAVSSRRIDTMYPARRMAYAAVKHWQSVTGCPLRYVAGTAFDAGLVSLYSGGKLQVFDTATATPWVSSSELERRGALYVLDASDPVPDGVADLVPFDIVPPDRAGRPRKTIKIGIRHPAANCGR